MTHRDISNELYSLSLDQILCTQEYESLEVKEARSGFSYDKLREYCAALANEGGGMLVLGLTDKLPRSVVGTNAFTDYKSKLHTLTLQFGIRIEAREETRDRKRVLFIKVPSHPIGVPLHVDGKYLMRSGEALIPMTSDRLRSLIAAIETDFSAEICHTAVINDLDGNAIAKFRSLWQQRSTNLFISNLSVEQLLRDAELMIENRPLYAALLMFGTKEALSRLLPQAEVIFEFRSEDGAIRHQQRVEFREGFISYQERLWDQVNLRNDVQQIQDGFFLTEVPTFNETVVREAILNAVSHRDYRLQGSIYIRQYPRRLVISSPGGFPPGITHENLLYKQFARNRRLAEALQKCGLIERSGQGVDTIFRRSLGEGKNPPDYSGSDQHEVELRLSGQVQDPQFVRFLETVSADAGFNISTDDTIILDQINRGIQIPVTFKRHLPKLIENGIIERVGGGRGTKYILSRRFYTSIGKPGVYTNRRGLDRSYRKALLHSHILHVGERGTKLSEMQYVLPAATLDEIKALLKELKDSGSIQLVGKTKGARWFAASQIDI